MSKAGDDDVKFMGRCLDLARAAEGMTYPNPLVGSVIVHNDMIIGEGFHLKAGGPHAEENAILSVKEKELLPKSVLYVNLEPCSHYGRRPPCAELIIRTGIKTVVIGTPDTSEKVSGRGIELLKNAGCKVKVGVLGEESRFINRRFFTFNEKKRPYIILKWAQSSDGFIDILRKPGAERSPTWVIGKAERILVHRWRAAEQSILVGAGTFNSDNPELTVRNWKGPNPVRLVLSGSGNLKCGQSLFKSPGTNIVFTYNMNAKIPDSKVVLMNENIDPSVQIAEYLYKEGIQSLIVEGGAKVLSHFISTGMWDEAIVFRSDKIFGQGIRAPEIKGKIRSETKFSSSTYKLILNH
jgi:diaminohydroxyphosphoribosylaminopyrimidine deaminase / 5-amino-6-(5-phosphoribosylamino)uracil reductase